MLPARSGSVLSSATVCPPAPQLLHHAHHRSTASQLAGSSALSPGRIFCLSESSRITHQLLPFGLVRVELSLVLSAWRPHLVTSQIANAGFRVVCQAGICAQSDQPLCALSLCPEHWFPGIENAVGSEIMQIHLSSVQRIFSPSPSAKSLVRQHHCGPGCRWP